MNNLGVITDTVEASKITPLRRFIRSKYDVFTGRTKLKVISAIIAMHVNN